MIFFLLTFALLHLLSADLTTLLRFSTVHIVGSFYLNFLRQCLIHWKGMRWICTINILSRLSPQFTAMQHKKWAWTASHPTQRPVQLPSTVPTLPTSSVWGGLGGFSGSFGFPSSVRSFSSWMAKDLIWSRCRVNMSQQKESGRSNWAAGGRKSRCSANAWWWWWRFLWLRYYSNTIFSLVRITFVVGFLRIKIHVAFR